MEQVKHTPGPWRVRRLTTHGQFITQEAVSAADGTIVCTLHANAKANGSLIAAAPDLLAALRDIDAETTGFDTEEMISAIQDICRYAIAKATGGQP